MELHINSDRAAVYVCRTMVQLISLSLQQKYSELAHCSDRINIFVILDASFLFSNKQKIRALFGRNFDISMSAERSFFGDFDIQTFCIPIYIYESAKTETQQMSKVTLTGHMSVLLRQKVVGSSTAAAHIYVYIAIIITF
jgi:hypothetical protein